MVKDAAEIAALARAGAAVDAIAHDMRAVQFADAPSSTCTENSSNACSRRGTSGRTSRSSPPGEHAASPHHEPSATRSIRPGEIVLCDFGGTMDGYCSDITRMFHVGEPAAEVRDVYAVLAEAQEAGVQAATCRHRVRRRRRAPRARSSPPPVTASSSYIESATGSGPKRTKTRTWSHGNRLALAPGHAFSVEPGIYLPGRFGMRLEDIVVATETGPVRLNNAARDIALVA